MREQANLEAEILFGQWLREAELTIQARRAAEQLGEAFQEEEIEEGVQS